MKRWLFWLFYLNPLSYGYEAIFANEFSRIDVSSEISLRKVLTLRTACV